MNKDKNFERRMIVSKYSNRPPFDLKKTKETPSISDKMKDYPTEECKSCCKNRTKNCKNILSKSNRSIVTEDLEENSNTHPDKKVISKIIETFKKANTSQESDNLTMSKNTSIQTLYRNTRSCKLGKNIPKHKLMKSLLQNLDSEVDSCKKGLTKSSKGRLKYKKSVNTKLIFDPNQPIQTDFSVSCEKKENSNTSTGYCCRTEFQASKIDKKTSTTGLVWPPKSREVLQYSHQPYYSQAKKKSSQKLGLDQQDTFPSYSTIKEKCSKHGVPRLSSDSFLEEEPTKDVTNKHYIEQRKSEKLIRKHNTSNTHFRQKSLSEKSENGLELKNKTAIPKKLQAREKSFVQTQVEKLNKVMRPMKIPGPSITWAENFNGGPQKKGELTQMAVRGRCGNLRREEATANYLGLMDRIRSNVPRIQKSDNYESYESGHGWSDSTETDICPERIRFPKETKAAIGQHLSEKKIKIPVSKFGITHDNLKPAYPPRENEYNRIQHGCLEGPGQRENHVHSTVCAVRDKLTQIKDKNDRKSRPVHSKSINIPCKKNLLCDKGERHSGPCGYTHNQNKVVY